MPPNTFSSGNVVTAAGHNQNWALAVLTDTQRTITVSHEYTASQTFTGGWTAAAACTITVASATAFAVGRQGATDPALLVHSSTASQATGIQITGKAATSGAAIAVISSGTNENLTIDAKGSGSITLGATSTGAITLTRSVTFSAAMTYGGVTLSQAATGTGNMVLSASPTFTGTITAAAATFSGVVGLPDGSASAPALFQASNTDVGLYFASNEISVTVNNSTKVTFDGTGVRFVGVGTTGSAANAFLDSGDSNRLLRSTSSLRYKQDVRDLSLDEAWHVIEGARAIAFRDKAKPERGEHIGLAAEDVAALDPRLVTYDKEGRVDWVQYPHLTAPLLVALADVRRRMEAAGLWQ